MRRRAKHQKHTVKLRHLLYLALITTVISSTTLARFALKQTPTASATIAAFVSGTDLNLDLGTHGALAPGEDKEITFHVKNYDENRKICEVPVDYEVQIETTKNLPLVFSLSGTASLGVKDENLNKPVDALNATTLLATGGKLPSAKSGEAEHSYTLKISWPSDQNAEEYSSEIDHLSVSIKTKQSAGNENG